MSPPISATLWRQQVEADKGPLTIDGHHIPQGTFFGVNIYALSHNSDIFPDPYTYNPDRWLTDDPALPKMKESFASFGIGPRDCTGKQLAYLELMLVAAKTLHQFDFERAPGPIGAVGDGLDRGRPDEFQILDGFNSAHDGPYLVFRPRV
jgi:cytochrome P450